VYSAARSSKGRTEAFEAFNLGSIPSLAAVDTQQSRSIAKILNKVMGDKSKKILIWLEAADEEYVAARTLIRLGFLTQGMILATTSVEKYLKALCIIQKIQFETTGKVGHSTLRLYDKLQHVFSKKPLSKDFLGVLDKVYQLRYPDSISAGYNLSLHQGKMLTALDEIVFQIRNGFKIAGSNGRLKFDVLLANLDQNLLNGNHSFGIFERAKAFSEPSTWYEMRVDNNLNFLESTYIQTADDDGKYSMKGMQIGRSVNEFTLQKPPVKK
jgi:HEPN domain-containing protein